MSKDLDLVKEKLEKAEIRFRLLAENSTDIISSCSPQFVYEYISPVCLTLLGYEPTEMVGHSIESFIHSDDLESFQKFHSKLLHSSEINIITCRMRHKAGQYVYIETTSHTIKDIESKRVLEIQSSSRDVTRHTQVQLELKRTKTLLAGIINGATDAIITLDWRQHITCFNQAAEKMFGYQADDLVGQPFSQFMPSQLRQLHEIHTSNAGPLEADFPSPNYFDGMVAVRANGEEFPIEVNVSELAFEDEKFFTVIIRDVSERQQTDDLLRKSREQLHQAQKMEAVGRLAGGVVHDFNNILTAIMGYSELSLYNLSETDPIYSNLIEIKKSAEYATNLTRQLLAFTRSQPHHTEQLDLNKVINEFSKLVDRMIGVDVELVEILDPAATLVKADPGQLEQIIMNLAVNARDAMPNGGKFILETQKVELDYDFTLQYPQFQVGPYILLTVSDTGYGMDKFTMQRIFEPFFTTKEVGKGTGLGLSIVYGLVKQNEGQILVYSEVGSGTTFKIYLPQATSEAENNEYLPDSPLASSRQIDAGTILVVEDDKGVQDFISKVLKSQNYQILLAHNGQEALAIVEAYSRPIHLALTDIVLPDTTGLELIKRLRKIRPNLQVVYMSGYSEGMVNQQRLVQANESFLAKPFKISTLLDKINNNLTSLTG